MIHMRNRARIRVARKVVLTSKVILLLSGTKTGKPRHLLLDVASQIGFPRVCLVSNQFSDLVHESQRTKSSMLHHKRAPGNTNPARISWPAFSRVMRKYLCVFS